MLYFSFASGTEGCLDARLQIASSDSDLILETTSASLSQCHFWKKYPEHKVRLLEIIQSFHLHHMTYIISRWSCLRDGSLLHMICS